MEPAAFDGAFRTRLANGLQVVVMPHGELPIVEARLLVDADPGEGRGGDLVPVVALALSKKAWTLAESYGCAQSPALVWREKVSFRERGPTARLPEMLDRLACWTRRSLDGDRVDHLREAAGKAGPSAGLSPSATAWAALRSAIYSPDGELLEGARLHAVQPSSAERWLREQLRPERSLLVLAGKVSPTPELLAQLERRFAAWKAFGPAPREHAPPALPARRRVVLVDVPGAERVTLGVAARLPRRAEADEAATLALAQLLSLRLRAAAGPASDVFMNVGGLAHAPFLSAWATVSAKHAPNAITAALDSLREVSAEPLTSVDANLVRWLVARWQSFRFDTVDGRSEGVEELFFADLPLDAWERLPASIAALTPERIRAAARATAVGREVVVVQGDAATLAPALRDAGLSPEVLPAPRPRGTLPSTWEIPMRRPLRTLLFTALAIAPFLEGCRCPTVDSGHRGIVFKTLGGGTSRQVLDEGMHVMPLWNSVIPYDVRVHEMKEQLSVLSSNGLPLRVEASVRFRPNLDELFELQTQIGTDYDSKLIAPIVRSEARKVFGRYQPEEIYSTKREEIEQQIYTEVTRALQGKHIVVEAVLIRDVELPEAIKTAISDKLAEEQRAQKMKFTLDRERQEAQRKQIEAEGILKYQNIVRQGLTPEYLQFKGIEATERLAASPNTKLVIVGNPKGGLPLIFQGDK